MRALAHILLGLSAVAALGCADQPPVEPLAASPITPLDVDQVNALLPFMVDRKGGELKHRIIDVPGQKLVVRETSQAFTFDVWIDPDGHPVTPPGVGDSTSALKRPTRHHGSYAIVCTSMCAPATSDEACDQQGCQPVSEETCGCTPPDCPGCIPLTCDSFVHGAVAGAVIM